MIKDSSIDQVRDRMDIADVLSAFGVEIKKDVALCPFHNEKTGSFHVWRKQNIFKCFGCGKSGDPISFITQHEHKTFAEAIEWLASYYKVPLEYDDATPEETEEKRDLISELKAVIAFADEKYQSLLHSLPPDSDAWRFITGRGYTPEIVHKWGIGYAPDDWKFLTTPLINTGKHTPAVNGGIVISKEGKTYDFYRGRVMIPIHDHLNNLVGFGGRAIGEFQPKYLNPCESLIYNKQKIWFGLNRAGKAIKDASYVTIVEGYFDVITLHEAGIMNVVAACGTEVGSLQAKFLKRYAATVNICFDGDKPGVEKAAKLIDTFLHHDFKVEITELPEDRDPDEYANNFFKSNSAT